MHASRKGFAGLILAYYRGINRKHSHSYLCSSLEPPSSERVARSPYDIRSATSLTKSLPCFIGTVVFPVSTDFVQSNRASEYIECAKSFQLKKVDAGHCAGQPNLPFSNLGPFFVLRLAIPTTFKPHACYPTCPRVRAQPPQSHPRAD